MLISRSILWRLSFFGILSLETLWTFPNSTAVGQEAGVSDDETTTFFELATVPELKLTMDEDAQQRLREVPREYAMCSLAEKGGATLKSVAIKLKGAAGSFQDFDDRPGLTIKVNKFKKNQRFHGMEKFHLNNSVQDDSLMSEWLGSEFFRKTGYPAPRAGHVRLRINDRDMGLYVIREGFDKPFMKRWFGSNDGNLYEGGFLQDIDGPLELDSGTDPDNRQDLIGLAVACHLPDFQKRKSAIEERLDIDRFLTFMAAERLCGHWDGYSLNSNNYRIFFPAKGKAILLPHGMDQLLQDPHAGLFDHSQSLLASAIIQNDQLRKSYQLRVAEMAKLFHPVEDWIKKIDDRFEALAPIFAEIATDQAEAYQKSVAELKDRLKQRAEAMQSLVENDLQQPIEFDGNDEIALTIALTDWHAAIEAENIKLDETRIAGVDCLTIERELFGDFSSSWRTRVLLPRGKFRFEARIKAENVVPIPDSNGRGAGIRLSTSGRSNELVGTSVWTPVNLEIDIVEDQRMVELVLELRARTGRAFFDRESLKLKLLSDCP